MELQENIALIRDKFMKLKQVTSNIHVTITTSRRKISETPAKITGVFNRFVCVTSKINNYEEDFTLSYVDILCGKIIVKELE